VIDHLEKLAAFLPRLAAAEWVTVDTEADSLHAYPEKLCLLQISWPGGDELIDPLAGLDLSPLLRELQGRELILHGADYDLRLLHRSFQFIPETVFDTMCAARLLGYTEFGLTNLIAKNLGITLEKGPQKMNWARRPLTERMEAYARNDTRYLRPLSQILRSQLVEKGRLNWQREVCARLIQECSQPRIPDPDSVWRIKGGSRLSRPALAVLRELWHWREEEALERNKPPYFVLSHELLVAISAAAASGQPIAQLLPPRFPPNRQERLAAAVERGLRQPPETHPTIHRTFGYRLTHAEQARFDDLKSRRDRRGLELGIDPTLIASRTTLVSLARDGEAEQKELMNWQRELLL
jgi:ribonuclease D